MAITAQDVNKLRKATGAGMMDCKKALTEAEGDFEKAVEILRKKGQKVSAKRADREASEGAIFIHERADGSEAVLIELNCETDFVARNEDFQALGQQIVAIAAAEKPASLTELKALSLGGQVISDALTDAMGKIGEKIDVSKFETISGGRVVTYLHPGSRIGVAVAFNKEAGDIATVGKDIAMQIAAMNPVAVDKDGVSEDVVNKEIEIGKDIARNEGKPEAIIEKIARGKLAKFFKDNTLLNQDFVKDTSKSVEKHIKDELGADVSVTSFKRVQLGAS
ncbi:MAG: translation elongation factor Ts [Simkaniaceae bacterium]|nr:translation elongation factor Ts [Simkaniaceae bacterium]